MKKTCGNCAGFGEKIEKEFQLRLMPEKTGDYYHCTGNLWIYAMKKHFPGCGAWQPKPKKRGKK